MRNLLMVLVAVLGTSAMVHAFPAKDGKTVPVKEIKATKQSKSKTDKKTKSVKSEAPKKAETAKVKK
ncbi:hypothetical protein [Flavobacterium sp. LC2016-01]|uniref:hypothetical protein n=1 Tax=Flavobacterium sp. LC2016-01 TaxID=2675876 RepID=UPI0012BAF418|nr:hypothetical protein [Flavobacterium sp. LC2016-01]MTH14847.1 hypothetical protein [Flavobacterium sp. LC2016-01]